MATLEIFVENYGEYASPRSSHPKDTFHKIHNFSCVISLIRTAI